MRKRVRAIALLTGVGAALPGACLGEEETLVLRTLAECARALDKDPAAAREAAARWRVLGDGAPARICEAYALEALGAERLAAVRLTDLAQDRGVVLSAAERGKLLEEAAALWSALGAPQIARDALASAARLGAPVAGALAAAEAQLGNWSAVLAALGPEDAAPALRVRALTELRRWSEARQALAGLAGPAHDLAAARLALAEGDRATAGRRLAAVPQDSAWAEERQALVQALATTQRTIRPRLRDDGLHENGR
ncbi:MAG: hypothetical protein AAF281_06025 [Pseudomonadota bacterium]